MEEILEILTQDARRSPEDIARAIGKSAADVRRVISDFEKKGIIVSYKTIINHEMLSNRKPSVLALIEVSITPQKDVGFDALAERIYKFPEVKTCYLVSGGYDLLVVVEGESIQTVAEFVASKLSPMESVRQTATHFLLKKYKEDGQILKKSKQTKRLNISY